MPKWLKFIVAILLLPFCVGAAKALWRASLQLGQAEMIWVPILGGAACWWVIFLMLPRPILLYVFGHEFTHVLWSWLFGGKVKEFRVGAGGGHVVVTKDNFVIALAPYFFPLYAFLVVCSFAVGHFFWGWAGYMTWFHLFLGAAYAFHVTLTWHILQARQSDITSQGYFFSAVVIFLGNIAVLLLGLALVTVNVSLPQSISWWWMESVAAWQGIVQMF